MSRDKLFKTSMMGSLPRNKEVLNSRRKFRAGMISKEEFDEVVERQTREIVEFQEKIGLDYIVSGEIARDNYVSFVSEKIGGVSEMSMSDMLDYIDDKEEFENILSILDVPASSIKNAICTGRLSYTGDIVQSEYKLVKKYTDKPVKITMPGPYLLTRSMWLPNLSGKFYENKEELGRDVVEILKKEVDRLEELGVEVVQFDEPVLTEIVFTDGKPRTFMCAALSQRKDPTEEIKFATSLIKEVMQHMVGKNIKSCLHVCRGNWSKNEDILLSGPYTPLVDLFSEIGCDILSLEFSTPRAGELKFLLDDERIKNKIIFGLGVINPRLDDVESDDSMYERAKEALNFIDKEFLWLNPDCGFATFSNRPVNVYDVIEKKLKNMVDTSNKLRKEFE